MDVSIIPIPTAPLAQQLLAPPCANNSEVVLREFNLKYSGGKQLIYDHFNKQRAIAEHEFQEKLTSLKQAETQAINQYDQAYLEWIDVELCPFPLVVESSHYQQQTQQTQQQQRVSSTSTQLVKKQPFSWWNSLQRYLLLS